MSDEVTPRQENKMGTMPVNRLLLAMSVPMMVSMLVQALYNVVDSIFVSWLSQDAMTAVSLVFPIQNLMIAVSVGTGVGINALLSRALGRGDFDQANRAANVGVLVTLLSSIPFALLGIFASRIFFAMQVDTPATIAYGEQYMFYICVFSFALFGQMVFSRLLQSTGKTFLSMVVQLVGAVLNVILDPILIFGYLGAPALGVAGAAIATVISQSVGMVLAIWLNIKYNKEIILSLRRMRPSRAIVKQIYAVGFPSILMQVVASFMIFFLNRILLGFSETAARVYGVFFKVQGFFFMPVFGLNNGIIPIIAYNYGAKRPGRITETTKIAILYATVILTVGFLVFQLAPGALLRLFDAPPDMVEVGVVALRSMSPCFLLAGYVVVCASVLQALGKGVASMMVALVRQLVFLVPLAYLLSLTGNLNLVWWSYPLAELAAMALSYYYMRQARRKIIEPLAREEEEGTSTS